MGNLEKAGVLVVVALLAVILVVAFLNFPDDSKAPPVLGATGKASQGASAEIKKTARPKVEPTNVPPDASAGLIRPKPEPDRPSSDAPPKLVGETGGPVAMPTPTPIQQGRVEDVPPAAGSAKPDTAVRETEKPAANGPSAEYPKTVKVRAGDTLWAIAVREYGAKTGGQMVDLIAAANPRVRPEALKTGTELTLPPPPARLASGASKPGADGGSRPSSVAGGKPPERKDTAPAKAAPAKPASTRKLPFVPE